LSYHNRPPQNKEVDQLNDSMLKVSQWLAGHRGYFYILVFVVFLVIWLLSGIYIVQPGEEGVVRTYGKFSGITTSGLNYHLPWPIQRATIVDVESIRRVEIGFRTTQERKQEVFDEALMLTEDENIVQVELLVQYRIASARDFVFNVESPEQVLLTSAEVALRSTVGQMTIDNVITEERARVQEQTRIFLARLLDDYGAGIMVTDVRLQVADPPAEVRDAFQEVVRAKADRERLINEAQAYQNDVVPRARGEKQRLIEEAAAFRDQQVLRATGNAERFLAVLEAYQVAPDVTRERMHIEALEGVLNQVELILMDGDAFGGQVLPFLPLTDPAGRPNNVEPSIPFSAPTPANTPPVLTEEEE
jgi:modulator of FtsH protease HflK